MNVEFYLFNVSGETVLVYPSETQQYGDKLLSERMEKSIGRIYLNQ